MPIIIQLIEDLKTLIPGLPLNNGQKNSLTVKLDGAIADLCKTPPNVPPACGKLKALVNQVQAFIQSGILTPEQGQLLIDALNDIRTELGCFQYEK
ncbi:MAG: hypothetical protein N2B06_01140 [Clostridium sp.]